MENRVNNAVFKKYTNEIENYRPISLPLNIGKIFKKLLKIRYTSKYEQLDLNQSKDQAKFRKN